jgi:hypothetical protein
VAHQFSLNETVITALQGQLAAELPATVQTVNADVSDGYTILDPVKVYDHVPPLTVLAGAGFPAVAIEDGRSRFENDLIYSVDGVHQLLVVAFVSNPDPEALAWQLRRYQQAIALAIQADRTLAGTVYTTRLNGIDPGPILAPSDKLAGSLATDYVGWFALEVEMPRSEV